METIKNFHKKIGKLFKYDKTINPPPKISQEKYEELKAATKDNYDLYELIESLISVQDAEDIKTDLDLYQVARFISYSSAIGLDAFCRTHKVPFPNKSSRQKTMEALLIYAFYRSLERFDSLELEEQYDKL